MTYTATGEGGTHKMASNRNRAQPTQQMIQLARRQSCCTKRKTPVIVVIVNLYSQKGGHSLGADLESKHQSA